MFRTALLTTCLLLAGVLTAQDPPIPEDKDPITTPRGLKYSVLKKGDSEVKAKLGDKVYVHYTGWLENGKVFDSSRKKGTEPVEFDLVPGRLIIGWILGLPMMHVGDVFKFTVPAELAYGRMPRPKIPPDSNLIFQVELIRTEAALNLPSWHPATAGKQKSTESGLKYEVLKEGAGEPPSNKEFFEVKYGLWTTDGILVECDLSQPSQPVTLSLARMGMPLFKEAVPLLRPGSRFRFEVPPELCFGGRPYGPLLPANSKTIWEIEVVRVFRPPPFSLSPKEKLKTTASGLQYEVLKEGTGKTPTAKDKVRCHYAGWLLSGKPFDSSYSRGKPAECALSGIIKGWIEGMQLMKEGAVYKFTIPPGLGYGTQDKGVIPANSTLVFHLHLIKVLDT